ncbi:hypothetical protein QYE76_026878 [Lolium multiflorum]|uniref:F-box domain-containing protein n=1 Tax=Lolium multiflorum TaxID=4521 RepID=A0AAD8RIJ6_LOLMU|nr:hypothetical protein QYE76_026878 [Lolium multiflorum]
MAKRPPAARSTAKPCVSSIRKRSREDRLSALPGDILVNILDRLHARDAARTCILSRRWSRLSAELSRLVISAKDFVPEGVSTANISGGDDLVRTNAAVVEATKSMLARRDPGGRHTVRLLSTEFYLSDDVPISIGHAIGNAMATHKIEKAEFTVLTVKESKQCRLEDRLNYGAWFVSFFYACLDVFTGLTRLSLENLIFSESDFLSNILGTCKQLKYLGFLRCGTMRMITHQVEHAQLCELSMVRCLFGKVELKWLPRLTRTDFAFWRSFEEIPLSFGHVPLLEVVSLENAALSWHKMIKLSTLLCETSVRDLMLGFRCEKIWVQPESVTKRLASAFNRLKIVNLGHIPEGYDLTWTMFILEAAPSLEEFYMTVIDHPCEMQMDKDKRREGSYIEEKGVEWESPTSNFKHHRLTKLIIFCFESYMASHVRRVMNAAVNLKYVYLYRRLSCDKCKHMKPLKPIMFPRSKKHRCSMRKQMTQCIESGARIHFLDFSVMSDDHKARLP